MRELHRSERRGPAVAVAVAMLVACVAVLGAAPAGAFDLTGKTTLDQTVVPTGGGAFKTLTTGAGEPFLVRQDLVNAQDEREKRRLSIVYFAQITDFQLSDEESPGREERFDAEPFQRASTSGYRPQEPLIVQQVEASIRQLNQFISSPVPQRDGSRARMLNAVMTGDLADSMQKNETEWVRTLLEGGALNPGSGTTDYTGTACAGFPTSAVVDGATPANFTGVGDYSDYSPDNPIYYAPDGPAGIYAAEGWPTYPNLFDRAQAPFGAQGLPVPTYVVFGNHDALYQGTVSAGPGIVTPTLTFEDMAVNCMKPVYPLVSESSIGPPPDPADLLAGVAGGQVMFVPPDINRQFVDKRQFKDIFRAGAQPDDHGFSFIDPAETSASNDQASYYSWAPKAGLRYIVLDTNSESGVLVSPAFDGTNSSGSEGNVDHPQFLWLQKELEKAKQADEMTILFSHHNIKTLKNALPDEVSPCSGMTQFGHDRLNPSCDRDPRASTPLHSGPDMTTLVHQYPNVVAWVAGHTHENEIVPFKNPSGAGGFWQITTPAISDWPPQNRVIDVMDNRDGTLSLFATILDQDAPTQNPAPGTDAEAGAGFTVGELASIGRTLSFNDPQEGLDSSVGDPVDRNSELLVRDPRKDAICSGKIVGTKRKDKLDGTTLSDRILGKRGNDRIRGKGGNDCLKGQRGKDRLKGGDGDDTLLGASGGDVAKPGTGKDTVKTGRGNDKIKARDGEKDKVKCGSGIDRVKADKIDRLKGCEKVRRSKG